jgi:hypothetical protein
VQVEKGRIYKKQIWAPRLLFEHVWVLVRWLCLEGLGLELPLLEAANLPCARGSVDLLDGQPFSVDGS